MADNNIHETNRNTKTARATQETGRTAAKQRPWNPRNCSTSRLICQFRHTLERCLQKIRPQGIRQQTAASPTMQAFRKTACQIAKTALERRVQDVCKRDFPGGLRLNGCRPTHRSLTLLSRSGITASIATWPIMFRKMYMSLRKLFVLPSGISVHENLCYVLSLRKPSLRYDSFH